MREEVLDLTGFSKGHLLLGYFGVPITTNKLSKRECKLLVEKITSKIFI